MGIRVLICPNYSRAFGDGQNRWVKSKVLNDNLCFFTIRNGLTLIGILILIILIRRGCWLRAWLGATG